MIYVIKKESGLQYKGENQMITHTNLLKPLPKPFLEEEVFFLSDDVILETNIDGIPYVVSDISDKFDTLYVKDKVTFTGCREVYTVKSVDYNKRTLEVKLDKVFQLEDVELLNLIDKHLSWNEPDIADKLRHNYVWDGLSFVIDGKLSKNQIVRYRDTLLKITELNKIDGLTFISGEEIYYKELSDIYPYKVDNEVKEWYFDIKDVWLRQAKEYKKGEE